MTDLPWVGILNARYLPLRGVVRGPSGSPAQAVSACAFTFLLLNSSCPLTQIPACLPFLFLLSFFFSFSLSFFPFLPSFLFCHASLRERCAQQLFLSSCFLLFYMIYQTSRWGRWDRCVIIQILLKRDPERFNSWPEVMGLKVGSPDRPGLPYCRSWPWPPDSPPSNVPLLSAPKSPPGLIGSHY